MPDWINGLDTTLQFSLQALGAIAILAGGVKVIIGFFNPYKALKEKTKKHDELLLNDHERLNREEEATAVILNSLFALLNHAITGNSHEGLKNARDNLQDHLSKR